jgi:hypothetical protein
MCRYFWRLLDLGGRWDIPRELIDTIHQRGFLLADDCLQGWGALSVIGWGSLSANRYRSTSIECFRQAARPPAVIPGPALSIHAPGSCG